MIKLLGFFAGIVLLTAVLPAIADSKDPEQVFEQRPSSAIDAAEVVAIQLNAMQLYNQDPQLSMATVFSFASPQNRAQTGPLARFSEMIATGYPSLLNHKDARLVSSVVAGDRAMQPVVVTDKKGGQLLYVFLLSKQPCGPEESKRCWMTDSVSLRGKAKPLTTPDALPEESQSPTGTVRI